MPDVSLITSLYKTEKHLPQYIDLATKLAREIKSAGINLEFVVISNDPSEMERQLLSAFDTALTAENIARVQTRYVGRESLYASWNRGIQHAGSDVLGFLNVDDKRTVAGISEGYHLLKDGQVQLAEFSYRIVSPQKEKRITAPFNADKLSPQTGLSPFCMFHRNLYDMAGGFNPDFRIAGDYEWSKRDAVRRSSHVCRDTLAGDFILHGDNLSGSSNPLEWVEYNIVLIWHQAFHLMRPVDPDLMQKMWTDWGYKGGTLPDNVREWLWGDGAGTRYQAYINERNQHPVLRRLRLALASRGLWHSMEWKISKGIHFDS